MNFHWESFEKSVNMWKKCQLCGTNILAITAIRRELHVPFWLSIVPTLTLLRRLAGWPSNFPFSNTLKQKSKLAIWNEYKSLQFENI